MTSSATNIAKGNIQSGTSAPAPARRRTRKVPEYLIREVIDGIPFFYKGYKEVLTKNKTFEDIMADSGLQSLIKKYLYDLLLRKLDPAVYEVFMGEVGAHLEHKSNLGLDVAVFETAMLPGDKFDFKYLAVVPRLVIEVDMKVSLDETGLQSFEDFLNLKTQKLFDFGTKRLLWVLTRSKKVVVATPGEDWKIIDWDKNIEVWAGIEANIGKHLKARGINPDIIFPA
jgi:hypothetical protein